MVLIEIYSYEWSEPLEVFSTFKEAKERIESLKAKSFFEATDMAPIGFRVSIFRRVTHGWFVKKVRYYSAESKKWLWHSFEEAEIGDAKRWDRLWR